MDLLPNDAFPERTGRRFDPFQTVAGVDERTVRRDATAAFAAVERPTETLAADGKLRTATAMRKPRHGPEGARRGV